MVTVPAYRLHKSLWTLGLIVWSSYLPKEEVLLLLAGICTGPPLAVWCSCQNYTMLVNGNCGNQDGN